MLQPLERLIGGEVDRQPRRRRRRRLVERLDALGGKANVIAIAPRVHRHQHRRARVQKPARGRQHFREHRHLEHARRVRHLHEGETVAPRRGALLLGDHRAGEARAGDIATRRTRKKIHPFGDLQALERLGVGIEGMGREVKADGLELVTQSLYDRPVGDVGQGFGMERKIVIDGEQAFLGASPFAGHDGGMLDQGLDGAEHLGAVGVEAVEGAGRSEAFQLALVDDLGIAPPGEVEEVGERPVLLALLDHRLHRLDTDVLERAQRIADRAFARRPGLDREDGGGGVDIGGQEPDAQALEFLAEGVELVGVAEIERHRGGEEFDRVIGLEIGGLIGDEGVGGGMGLVEAVARELVDLLENVPGRALVDAPGDGAVDEVAPLFLHLRLDLLAHGVAQHVGGAEAVAGQHLGDLHDLFLIDHHPEGRLEDLFQGRMQIVGLLVAVLAGDIARDVVHRPGPEQGHQRDDVLEAVGPQLAQHVAHARAFELEHPGGLAPRQHLVGGRVVERQAREIERNAAFGDECAGALEHGEGLEA